MARVARASQKASASPAIENSDTSTPTADLHARSFGQLTKHWARPFRIV
jgi:hypothetical protein